ncbi:hypothetical protein ACFYS8_22775 [Kitasatospora sp. NPDC004615]
MAARPPALLVRPSPARENLLFHEGRRHAPWPAPARRREQLRR